MISTPTGRNVGPGSYELKEKAVRHKSHNIMSLAAQVLTESECKSPRTRSGKRSGSLSCRLTNRAETPRTPVPRWVAFEPSPTASSADNIKNSLEKLTKRTQNRNGPLASHNSEEKSTAEPCDPSPSKQEQRQRDLGHNRRNIEKIKKIVQASQMLMMNSTQPPPKTDKCSSRSPGEKVPRSMDLTPKLLDSANE